MAERITIIVEPSLEHGGVLTVQDAMRQVLDFVEVVAAAASDDARAKFGWKLISATTNSPFEAVAEAFSLDPEWPADQYAREAKSRVDTALRNVPETGAMPEWLSERGADQFKRIFRRNLNGVGKTTLRLGDEKAPVVIVERRARQALDRIEQNEATHRASAPDFSGEELGSIDAHVLDATTYYGRPALRIRDRLTENRIVCVIPAEIADAIGQSHDWRDVWGGERVRISGRIKRNVAGEITLITADSLMKIESLTSTLAEVVDPNFTGGKGAREYLDELWDGPGGEG